MLAAAHHGAPFVQNHLGGLLLPRVIALAKKMVTVTVAVRTDAAIGRPAVLVLKLDGFRIDTAGCKMDRTWLLPPQESNRYPLWRMVN